MAHSMTFTAQSQPVLCGLCRVNPATLEFNIHSEEQDESRQQGSCCAACGHNLLDALAQTKS